MDLLPGGCLETREMTIPRDDAEAVVNLHEIPVVAACVGDRDRAVGGGAHRLSIVGRDVEARVKIGPSGEGIAPIAVGR